MSSKTHGMNPEEWLEDALHRINGTRTSELNNLLPHRWSKACPQPH
ncbi:MAG: transposase domain-containing protein [Flavobacteriales bacterium]